ncbi:MAG: DUF4153 domain-containing protein [Alphaproteobacteria bacterium]|nr:DUF4153 domain-containing protein [Alphaproteobacteria bacterium]
MTLSETAAPWPQRAGLLAVLGLVLGWLVADISDGAVTPADSAIITGLIVFGVAFGLLWDRGRLVPAAGFAVLAALVAAAAGWWSGISANGSGPDLLRLPSAVIAIAVAVPLFQAWHDARSAGGAGLPYARAHDRAWTDLVTVAAALGFTLVSWLLAWMLASLFKLIGFGELERMLGESRVACALLGAAFGGGGALARDSAGILSTLQRVLRFVLSALTPVLAVGLALFLLALPFTGLAPLWEATKSTTPILLFCIASGLVLANAVIADAPEDESRRRLLRLSAGVLVGALLPLAVLASVSLGQRIGQHGWTPDRLWASVVVAVALAYGIAGLWALLRRSAWMARVRRGNLVMAFLLCGVALLLATPLMDFGAISTRSQLARLESGQVRPDKFDWAALRFDFGPSGEAAVRRLAAAPGATGQQAKAALKAQTLWQLAEKIEEAAAVEAILVIPRDPAGGPRTVPPGIADVLKPLRLCDDDWSLCVLHLPPGADTATLYVNIDTVMTAASVVRFRRIGNSWMASNPDDQAALGARAIGGDKIKALRAAILAGRATIRTVEAEQLVIDGEPVAMAPPER